MDVTGAADDAEAQAASDEVTVEPLSLAQVWEQIEAVVPREQITQVLWTIALAVPAEDDVDATWRAELVKRHATVRAEQHSYSVPRQPQAETWVGTSDRSGTYL
jgi:hypothetical protein